MSALVTKNWAFGAKIEATEGVFSAPTASDCVLVDGQPRLNFKPNMVKTNEATGSLDGFGSLVGGMTVEVQVDCYLKGSGTAGTAPEWGKLAKLTGWAETITAAPLPAAAEAATGGGASSLTLGTSALATTQLYRYMPLALSVNPASGLAFITDYTAAKVATLTDAFAPVLDNTTKYQILPNVRYMPVSTGIPSASMSVWISGVRYNFAGCRGNWQLSCDSGGVAKWTFAFWGMFVAKVDDPVPAITPDPTRAPVWKGGKMLFDSKQAALKTLSFTSGIQLVHPDNPNAAEGYDPAVITGRDITGNMDPLDTLVATRDLMTVFRSGAKKSLHAMLGTVAGNRIGITVGQALVTNQQPGDRSGLATVGTPFECTGQDSGLGICLF